MISMSAQQELIGVNKFVRTPLDHTHAVVIAVLSLILMEHHVMVGQEDRQPRIKFNHLFIQMLVNALMVLTPVSKSVLTHLELIDVHATMVSC